MNKSFSQKQGICKELNELKLSIFNTLLHDKMWISVANDILKTPSFNSGCDERNNADTISMIKLLPSYQKLLIHYKEKLIRIINTCQPNDYENVITALLHNQSKYTNSNNNNNNIQSNDYYNRLQLLISSSSNLSSEELSTLYNQCSRIELDNLQNQLGSILISDNDTPNNHHKKDQLPPEEIMLDSKGTFRPCSSFSNFSSALISSNSSCSLASFSSSSSPSTGDSLLTLCPVSSTVPSISLQSRMLSKSTSKQISKRLHNQQTKKAKNIVEKLNGNEGHLENSIRNLFQSQPNSPSTIRHSLCSSFSDGDSSSFSSCFNNVEFTVMNQDQLISLASALDSRSSRLDCRQKALKQLVHLPIIDVQACEVWIYLNENISTSSPSSPALMKTTSLTKENTIVVNQDHSVVGNNLSRSYSSVTNHPVSIVDKIKLDYKTPSRPPTSASKSKRFDAVRRVIQTEMNSSIDDSNDNINKLLHHTTTNKDNISSTNTTRDITSNIKMITTGGLRRGLADALNDEDDILWSLSLRYISKGLSTTPPNIRETYSLLIEYLQLQFTQNAYQYPLLVDGVDFQQNHNKRVLRACYLMNRFHQTIPFYWIRYSEQFVNEIIGKCLNILSIGCEHYMNEQQHQQHHHQLRLTPFHLFSLIDCDAKWFIQSTHGAYCCNALIVQLKKNYQLFEFTVFICLIYMNNQADTDVYYSSKRRDLLDNENNAYYYTYEELMYTSFLHSIQLVCRVLCFSNGRNLFPIKMKQQSVIKWIDVNQLITVNYFLCRMLQFLHRTTFTIDDIDQTQHPFTVIKCCLTRLTLYETFCQNCLSKENLLRNRNVLNVNIVHHHHHHPHQEQQQPGQHPSKNSLTTTIIEEDDYINLINSKEDTLSFISLLLKYLVEFFLNKNKVNIERLQLYKLDAFIEILYNILSHKTGQIILQNSLSEPLHLITSLLDFIMKLLYQSIETLAISTSITSEYYRLLLNVLIKVIHCGQFITRRTISLHFDDIHHFNDVLIQIWYKIIETKLVSKISSHLLYTIQEKFLTDLQNCLIYAVGSPIGVDLFTKSNLLRHCTEYLQKFLINKCNISFSRPHTFGYLISQLALNKSSLLSLSESGIIQLLVKYAWDAIEYFDSIGDVNLTGNYTTMSTHNPPIWSIDPIDKIAYKPFVNLVRVTTSYECIEHLLNSVDLLTNKEHYDPRLDVPTNLSELIDRIILVNTSTVKLHSLYNPEQCQLFGLRLLSCIISCLDSLLWFEAYFNLTDYLLNCQNINEYLLDNIDIVYDALTIERNYLLMKIYFIGGSNERELPPRILCQHTKRIYPYKMIQSKLVDSNYSTMLKDAIHTDDKCNQYPCSNWYIELFPSSIKSQLLTHLLPEELINRSITSLETAKYWIYQCQSNLKNSNNVVNQEEFNQEVNYSYVSDIFDQCLLAMNYINETNSSLQLLVEVNNDEVSTFTLSKMDEIAIDWTIRYGLRNGSLPSINNLNEAAYTEQHTFYSEQLHKLMCTIRVYFQMVTKLSCYQEVKDEPFDWFVATIFLVYQGNYERAWNFLSKYSTFPHSVYLWPNRCKHQPNNHNSFYVRSCQYFEDLLALECSNVYNLFVMAEMTPVQIYSRWINQCYWNYFDWINIVNYLLVCLLNPIQFQLYTNLCILKHLSPALLYSTNEQSTSQLQQTEQLIVFLQEEPIRGFDFVKYLPYMYDLDKKYTEHLHL